MNAHNLALGTAIFSISTALANISATLTQFAVVIFAASFCALLTMWIADERGTR